MFPFKHTPFNSWSPLAEDGVAGGAIRLYDASVAASVTSAGSATRFRAGVQSADIIAGAEYAAGHVDIIIPTDAPPQVARDPEGETIWRTDGQGFVELGSGRFLLMGGAPAGYASNVVNAIWYSDDRGKTWAVLLADGSRPGWSNGYNGGATHSTSTTRPEPMHTFAAFTMTIASVEYVYWLGGDPFLPAGKVWRSANGGATWALVSTAPHTACPTTDLALYMYGVLGTTIYIMGGQDSVNDGAATNAGWQSTDYGETWEALQGDAAPPWAARTAQLGKLPEKDGYLWVIGGGRYHSSDFREMYNDVWRFDGDTWEEMLADDDAPTNPLPRTRYHSTVVYNGKLWRFNGSRQYKMLGGADLTFSAGAKTVVRSAGSWIDDGFLEGRGCSIFGSASNNRSLPIVSVTDLTLTLSDPGNLMVTEGPVGGCSAHSLTGDTVAVHFSSNGATWTEWEDDKPWGPCHAQAAIASSDGIYLTSGFESDNLFVIREHTGPRVSKWEDLHTSSTFDLEESVDAKKPLLVADMFGAGKPGIVATGGQRMKLTTADVDIAAGGFEAWAIIKSMNFDESNQGCIVVGSRIGDGAYNLLNLLGAKLQHIGHGGAGTGTATSDNDLIKQDVPHLIGVQFYPAVQNGPAAVSKLFVDGVEVAVDNSNNHPAFDPAWTGWQSIFTGNTGGNDVTGTAALAMGALVIRRGASAPWDAAAIAKLSAWSREWGVAP